MKKCKNCKEKFTPRFSTLEKYCWSPDCKTIEAMEKLDKVKKAQEKKRNQEDKEWRKRKKETKEKLKTKQDYEKELEKIFNKFIRLRDKDKPCISCGAAAGTYTLTAGHYYPAGSYKNIRFDEDNVHSQCWFNCNKNKSGNLSEYRIGLIDKIGINRVKSLDERRNIPAHFSVPEIEEMKIKYKQKIKELK